MSDVEQTQILQNDRAAQEREKILDWTSTFDNESKHNAIRVPRVAGTGEWLTNTKEFETWRMGVESPSMLWCELTDPVFIISEKSLKDETWLRILGVRHMIQDSMYPLQKATLTPMI